MSCYIGIDIGGTNFKAARLWPKNDEIAEIYSHPTPETLPSILEAAKDAIRFLGKGAKGILITGQMGCLYLKDKVYSWQTDKTPYEIIVERGKNEDLTDYTPWSWIDYIAAMLNEDFVRREAKTHLTNAQASGAYHWNGVWKHGLEGTELSWPRNCDELCVIGTLGDIPIYLPVGDHQCSLLGAGLQNHELSVNLGTGGQISILGGTDRPYFDGRGLTCHVRLPAGRALASLQNLLNRPWVDLESAAERVTCERLRCHFALYPGPCGDSGRFDSMTEPETTPGHFYRAALESIARNVENCTVGMPRFDTVRLSGGMFARSDLLRNLVAARFPNKKIEWNKKRAGVESLYGLMELAKGLS